MDLDTINYTLPVKPEWSSNRLELAGAEVYYFPQYLHLKEASGFFDEFNQDLAWETRTIKMFGKLILQPRQISFYGDKAVSYRYSGQDWIAKAWHKKLLSLKERITEFSSLSLNCCLANLYLNNSHNMGWHADNEKDLSNGIASLSLGQSRDFLIRNRLNEKLTVRLNSGDLLLMLGETQINCKHSLPKVREQIGPRINLTFRYSRYKPMSKC